MWKLTLAELRKVDGSWDLGLVFAQIHEGQQYRRALLIPLTDGAMGEDLTRVLASAISRVRYLDQTLLQP